MNSTHYNKEIYVKDYFDIHNHYVSVYSGIHSNCKILILMAVGSFHECYNTDTDGPDLTTISEKLDMIVTQKNKNKPLSLSNPRMMGFPSYIVDEVIDKIISIGYTIVRIDQTTEPPNPKREVVGIYSSSTHINNNNNNTNNIISIVLDGLKLKTSTPILCIGLTSYCMMTGEGCVYETVGTTYDTMIALDNTVRFLEKYPPSEIVLYCSKGFTSYISANKTFNHMTVNDILRYIGISDTITTYKLNNSDMITNMKYQQTILCKIFGDIMENINLHVYNMARISLVGIMDFFTNHMPLLLEKLTKPKYFDQSDTLFLGNKALEQLDILPMENKPKTLFQCINKTRTPMGKRFLKDNLATPTTDINILNNRYNMIEKIIEREQYETIYNNLTNITDLSKTVRKMELLKIFPNEMANFYLSLKQIHIAFTDLDKKIAKLFNIDKNILSNINEIICLMDNTFDIDYMMKLNFINYKDEDTNYILTKNYPKIIELTETISMGNNFMNYLVKEFEKHIEENKGKLFIKKEQSTITLKYNDREGHYMLLTKRRSKILRANLAKLTNITIGTMHINIDDLEFIDLPRSNNTKICCKDVKKISIDVVDLKKQLAKELKEAFYIEVNNIITKYKTSISEIIERVEILDFINSGAICAFNNGYSKPSINSTEISYFEAKQLRHPIVELLCNDVAYHPHDITIGKDTTGILLYGINSSGKSTLMKSIGLAIVMAQIGYFVPASSFIYSPYRNLFTRIVGIDNIFRGMSSFMVEMMELMAILKRNTQKTLVLGDEICRGTEEKSANIIVAYMLETLVKSNTSFITATHLHSIASLPSVTNLPNIKICHLKINYDEKKDCLIYSRELIDGQGDKYYGVMVAKYLMKSDDFNNRTKELEMEYEDYNIKKSNYNKEVLMIQCATCDSKKNLETHHINFQKDCDKIKVTDKPHIKKNKPYNLVVLCRKCHDMIDRNDIIINGWVETSNNTILDWYKNTSRKKNNNLSLN
jgi:DNA mismatch repair protein MutS